jgi:hypothetical protein
MLPPPNYVIRIVKDGVSTYIPLDYEGDLVVMLGQYEYDSYAVYKQAKLTTYIEEE